MILGYLAYVVVFTFGLMTGCVLAASKIEELQRQVRACEDALTTVSKRRH